MKENLQFFQAFLKNPLKVGAIAPSSPELAAKMLEGITPNENNIVIELGVGTGAITKFLQQKIPNNESYLGIELDADLVKTLKERYAALKIVCGSACETFSIHQNSGLGKVGAIIAFTRRAIVFAIANGAVLSAPLLITPCGSSVPVDSSTVFIFDGTTSLNSIQLILSISRVETISFSV